jgi:uncharacterized protein (DUF305 family)
MVVVLVAVAAYGSGSRQRPGAPGDDSADAGFARDMTVHHAQAVEMAEAIRFRTADADLRMLATDIALTQQAQIGRMSGWLDTWGLPATGRRPAMAWMGHGPGRAMPGMATREELTVIRQAPLPEAETVFLQAMIRHHQGGVTMAEGLLAQGGRREVRRLAEKIVVAQQTEIAAMSALLEARGVAAPADTGRSTGGGGSASGTPRGWGSRPPRTPSGYCGPTGSSKSAGSGGWPTTRCATGTSGCSWMPPSLMSGTARPDRVRIGHGRRWHL